MRQLAEWLGQTALSLTIQTQAWVIPTVQSIHIVAIGVVLGSVLMIMLRILGRAGREETLTRTTARFGPWVTWGLWVLLVTGVLMIIGEPARELLALSFWLKMAMVVLATTVTLVFRRSLRLHEASWEGTLVNRASIKAMAVTNFLMWLTVVVLGRLIAYDYIWGSWSTLKR